MSRYRLALLVVLALPAVAAFGQGLSGKVSFAGDWSGTWKNSVGESGEETLSLKEKADGTLTGVWSGDIHVKGERLGKNTFYFEADTGKRFYRCAGQVEDGVLKLNYSASRPDTGGSTTGGLL
jgi:hypothetical protein